MEDGQEKMEAGERYSYLIDAANACKNGTKASVFSAQEFMWTIQTYFLESDFKIEALEFTEWAKAVREILIGIETEKATSPLVKESIKTIIDTLTRVEEIDQHPKLQENEEMPRRAVLNHGTQNMVDILCGPANPDVEWDQRNYESFRKSLSPRRLEEDKAALRDIFADAARVPLLADALDWALENGVRFYVDYTMSAGAYYQHSTGVVGVSAAAVSPEKKIFGTSYVVHELIHALQDKQGALSVGEGFVIDYMKITTTEIAAYEFQWAAANQYDPNQKKMPRRHAPDMALGFHSWQRNKYLSEAYGERLALSYGQLMGLGAEGEDLKIEVQEAHIARRRINRPRVGLKQIFDAINSDFKGNSWFDPNSAAVSNVKDAIFDTSRAACFYQPTRKAPTALVQKICDAQKTDLFRRLV